MKTNTIILLATNVSSMFLGAIAGSISMSKHIEKEDRKQRPLISNMIADVFLKFKDKDVTREELMAYIDEQHEFIKIATNLRSGLKG